MLCNRFIVSFCQGLKGRATWGVDGDGSVTGIPVSMHLILGIFSIVSTCLFRLYLCLAIKSNVFLLTIVFYISRGDGYRLVNLSFFYCIGWYSSRTLPSHNKRGLIFVSKSNLFIPLNNILSLSHLSFLSSH